MNDIQEANSKEEVYARYSGKFTEQKPARGKAKGRVNKKSAVAVIAVVLAVAAIFGGTSAWQSISQTALNEASDVINPDGRLHNAP